MSWVQITNEQLSAARAELAAAEDGLCAGTDAARARYARALHEADRAERLAARCAREVTLPDSLWARAEGVASQQPA